MREVLAIDQAASDVFSFFAGGYQLIHMPVHRGGTWTLQIAEPGDDTWIDTDLEFTEADSVRFYAFAEMRYRLTGGTTGARASASGVNYL